MAPLTFYFDRTFGKKVPIALDRLRGTPFLVRHHQGEGHHNKMPDDEWLEKAGSRNWVVLTQDYKFHRPGFEHEMAAITAHSVKCFYFPCADESNWETMCTFARFHRKLIESVSSSGPCFIKSMSKVGRISSIYDAAKP